MIHNPSSLYSGGSAVVNSQPATQFYLQSMAKKRAKDEALDNYYRDFQKSINPAGVRNQDIDGYMKRVNEWRDFYQQNKEAIKNPRIDNGKAYSEFMSRNQDALSYIQRSKNEAETSKNSILPVVGNPDKRSRATDLTIGAFHNHDLPLDDPNHKSLDPSIIDFDEKDWDTAAQNTFLSYTTRGIKPDKAIEKYTVDPKTHSKTTFIDYEYSPESLKTVGDRAMEVYGTDQRTQAGINKLADDPTHFDEYNNAFKTAYGRDIVSHADFAAAVAINKVQKQYSEQKGGSYNPFLGQHSGGSGASKENPADVWANSVVQAGNIAAQSGDVTQLRNVASQLFTGNAGRRLGNKESDVEYKMVNGRPAVNIVTYPITKAERDKEYDIKEQAVKDGKMDKRALDVDGLTSTFYLDEPMPQLLSKLKGAYQQVMGSDASAEKVPNYTPPVAPPAAPKTTQKPSTGKKKKYNPATGQFE